MGDSYIELTEEEKSYQLAVWQDSIERKQRFLIYSTIAFAIVFVLGFFAIYGAGRELRQDHEEDIAAATIARIELRQELEQRKFYLVLACSQTNIENQSAKLALTNSDLSAADRKIMRAVIDAIAPYRPNCSEYVASLLRLGNKEKHMAVKGTLRNMDKRGKATPPNVGRGSAIVAGVKDTNTGKIIKRPVPSIDLGIKSGGSVRITNPNAAPGKVARRYGTIGFQSAGRNKY